MRGRLATLFLMACGTSGARDAIPDAGGIPICADLTAVADDCPAASVDVGSLLEEMIDLDALASRRCPAFTTLEASSYDRHSISPEPDTPSAMQWYANMDWANFLRVEERPDGEKEYVMADVDGPGALVKMWTANDGGGIVRIYLDGSPEPVIAEEFARLLSGDVAPFVSPFGQVNAIGMNLDFPIPFRSHLKVTLSNPGYYYNVVYRLYAGSVDVTSLSMAALPLARMQEIASVLRGDAALPVEGVVAETRGDRGFSDLIVPAAEGGSAITELVILPEDLDDAALRASVLSLTFDGQETARVPLGDFFGGGPGFHPHRTLPIEVTQQAAMISRFVMPFGCYARVRLEHPGTARLRVMARHKPFPFRDDAYYFHAHFTARGPLLTDRYRDLTYAAVDGEGAYVGSVLSLDARSDHWWGEGDEKIWVDGGAFPAWFGTGTEDYFGYAYSQRTPFNHAYRTLFITGSARGQVASARFHILDPIPFRTSLKFDMELWAWDQTDHVYYDTVSYFYARPDAIDLLPAPRPEDFRLP